jgi:hypothetical protein
MSTPDHSYILTQMAGEPQWQDCLATNSPASISQFTQEAGRRLSAHDPEWGYMSCPNSEPHITLPSGAYVSNDAFFYRPTMDGVQVLDNASADGMDMTGEARTQWELVKTSEKNEWLEVTPVSTDPKLEDLERRIVALEQNAIQFGQTVALQADGGLGKYLCADEGGPQNDDERFNLESRSTVGPWESWKTRKGVGPDASG